MGSYNAWTGRADYMLSGMLTTAGAIREAIARFEELGADEVMLYCHGRDPEQADRFADLI